MIETTKTILKNDQICRHQLHNICIKLAYGKIESRTTNAFSADTAAKWNDCAVEMLFHLLFLLLAYLCFESEGRHVVRIFVDCYFRIIQIKCWLLHWSRRQHTRNLLRWICISFTLSSQFPSSLLLSRPFDRSFIRRKRSESVPRQRCAMLSLDNR